MNHEATKDKLEEFKADVSRDGEIGEEQRLAANEDMRFINVPGGMWEGFMDGPNGKYTSDRVKLELDLVSNSVNRFLGEWNLNRTGVEYKPDDSKTTSDEADLLNGIYRFAFRKGSGKLATDNAVDEAATCGFGAFKMATVFEDSEDPENDNMDIEWRPIYNAYSTVFWDQSAQRIDKRDARYCTVLARFTKESFSARYPDSKPVSAYTPNEVGTYGDSRDDIFIATRYEVIKKNADMFVYNNLQTGKIEVFSKEDHEDVKDDLRRDEFRQFVRKRKIVKQIVEKTVFSGDEILEPTRRIAGKWIPIISIYGRRSYVDGVEFYRGLVRPLKDAARLFNMQTSKLAEMSAEFSQEVPIFNPEQVVNPNIKRMWEDKVNLPYLLIDPVMDHDGNVIQAGPSGYSRPGALDPATTALLGIVPQFIQDVTGGPPQESYSKDMSGKAINALIKRENMNTQVINDNIANSMVWNGTVFQAMALEVYTNMRKVRVIGKDSSEGESQLLEQVVDEETGRIVEVNNLSNSKFQAYADAGPQYETRSEQTVEDLKGMLTTLSAMPAAEQYLPSLLAVLFDNITGVGLDPIKDFNRNVMLTQGLVEPQTPEEKSMVEAASQPKEDPNAKLLEAAAIQQESEARNLDASAVQKTADANKKVAETEKIRIETGISQVEVLNRRSNDIAKQAQGGLGDL